MKFLPLLFALQIFLVPSMAQDDAAAEDQPRMVPEQDLMNCRAELETVRQQEPDCSNQCEGQVAQVRNQLDQTQSQLDQTTRELNEARQQIENMKSEQDNHVEEKVKEAEEKSKKSLDEERARMQESHEKEKAELHSQIKARSSEAEKHKSELDKAKREHSQAQERVLQLEKDARYYWDLLDEYQGVASTYYVHYRGVASEQLKVAGDAIHRAWQSETVQENIRPAREAVEPHWNEFMKVSAPHRATFAEYWKTYWVGMVVPQMKELHAQVETGFCAATSELVSLVKGVDGVPAFFISSSKSLSKNCKSVISTSEQVFLAWFVYYILFGRGRRRRRLQAKKDSEGKVKQKGGKGKKHGKSGGKQKTQ